jgi:hypothetical protein
MSSEAGSALMAVLSGSNWLTPGSVVVMSAVSHKT